MILKKEKGIGNRQLVRAAVKYASSPNCRGKEDLPNGEEQILNFLTQKEIYLFSRLYFERGFHPSKMCCANQSLIFRR